MSADVATLELRDFDDEIVCNISWVYQGAEPSFPARLWVGGREFIRDGDRHNFAVITYAEAPRPSFWRAPRPKTRINAL